MQIPPIGSLEVSLANLSATLTMQQQFSTAVAAQPAGAGLAPAQEKHAPTKTRKSESSNPVAQQQQLVQPAIDPGVAAASTGAAFDPTVERQLFDYLFEVERAGSGGEITDLPALAAKAFDSLNRVVEQYQQAVDSVGEGGLNESPLPQDGISVASGEVPRASFTKSNTATDSDVRFEKLLEQFASLSLASLNINLATASVSAATSSVTSLVRQQ